MKGSHEGAKAKRPRGTINVDPNTSDGVRQQISTEVFNDKVSRIYGT